jgi:flavin reductase (DIM6/NTAB) family NADH-FMN oxidoreductase RutF
MPAPFADFNELMSELDYPMFIVTTVDGDEIGGCLIGFASQTSIDPSRFLACLSVKNRTTRLAARAQWLAVHFVPAGAGELAELFGGATGDEVDKFSRCEWRVGPAGLPILAECPDWFAGRVLERLPGGDHEGFLLEPFAGEARGKDAPLTFQRAKVIDPGHEA